MASQIVRVDALRVVAFGSITGSYTPVGTAFTHIMRTIRFVNTTDADVLISFDTVNDNIIVPAGSFVLYDCTTNREESLSYFVFSIGTQVFIKQSSGAPSKGSFYVECLFGQGE
jgi:hypothetical protein